jgi:hypothetical protein
MSTSLDVSRFCRCRVGLERPFRAAGSTGGRNTLVSRGTGVGRMKQRRRIYYSAVQRAEIWDHWKRGERMHAVGRLFDHGHSSIVSVLAPTGGIRPPPRQRSRLALTLAEREEISRGLSCGLSLRAIAYGLKRALSTISREVERNGGGRLYRAGLRPGSGGSSASPKDLQACKELVSAAGHHEQVAAGLVPAANCRLAEANLSGRRAPLRVP